MYDISPSSIRRFLAAAGLALAIPMLVVAAPGGLHDGGEGEAAGPAGAMGRPGRQGGELVPPYLRRLNLDEAQRDRVFAIIHESVPSMRERLKTLNRAEGELRRLTTGADYSEAKLKAQAEVVGRALSEVALLRARTDHQIFELLTVEQRQQLAEAKPEGGPRPHVPGGEDRLPPR